jgi:SWI/SNF-related matrix-associated actin-dependent regulator of chromatin subfamily A3
MQHLSEFRKSIATPFEQGGRIRKNAIDRFTLLLDALCLRRTKDLLHLPEQHNRVRMIDFSADERLQYDRTSKMMFRAVRNQVGGFDHKSMLGMFQVQLQLRILCNHGTFQKPFSWNRRKLHLLDEREDMESALGRDGEITCTNCKETLPLFSAGQMYRRYTEHCRHVLCFECLEESSGSQSSTLTDCPLCSSLWGSASATHAHSQRSKQAGDTDQYFRQGGRSSKVEVLVEDVQQDLLSTKRYFASLLGLHISIFADNANSIIFTCWTRTLDLIESSLQRVFVNYLRIDGDCPTSKREKILDDFAKNPLFRVLIMTTGTGAVG